MSFDKLIIKVGQAEDALEAQERRVAANVRQLKHSWLQMWTPGRIVIVGLVTGFLTGRAEPLRSAASSGSVVRIVSMLSGLYATATAHAVADDTEHAADSTGDSAAIVDPGVSSTMRPHTRHSSSAEPPPQ